MLRRCADYHTVLWITFEKLRVVRRGERKDQRSALRLNSFHARVCWLSTSDGALDTESETLWVREQKLWQGDRCPLSSCWWEFSLRQYADYQYHTVHSGQCKTVDEETKRTQTLTKWSVPTVFMLRRCADHQYVSLSHSVLDNAKLWVKRPERWRWQKVTSVQRFHAEMVQWLLMSFLCSEVDKQSY